ncbi:hypothetical protein ACOZ4I_19315 (plasmid) [Haloarcula salina]|uniref:hypothetical protein n=1 Tax=Haloarcula salina TaxID=1429914 RepID=UPI003C6FC6BA
MTRPDPGEVVTLTDVESEPPLLVCRITDDHVSGVLLADLAAATLQRLEQSVDDHERRAELATAIQEAASLPTFEVPVTECRRDERDSNRPGPFEEGGQ